MRKRFQKRSVFAKEVDMSPYSRSNIGYKYLLTVIDVFSKYGWIVPLKPKTGRVAMAFQKLFTTTNPPPPPPRRVWTDKGTEFYNQQLKRVLTVTANNVTLYSAENEDQILWNDGIGR